jgi:hypothetical protein
LEADQRDEAQAQLTQLHDALFYVEADLPLGTTRHLVAQAKADLAKGDVQAANEALASAEDNVVFTSVSFESLLIKAKAALAHAREEFDAGQPAMAATELGAAVKALQTAAKSADQRERQDAGKLIEEVRELHTLLENNDAGFRTKFEHAAQRLQALSERTAEYISTAGNACAPRARLSRT